MVVPINHWECGGVTGEDDVLDITKLVGDAPAVVDESGAPNLEVVVVSAPPPTVLVRLKEVLLSGCPPSVLVLVTEA